MITQKQQNEMDATISYWLSDRMNECESGEEQGRFLERVLGAAIGAHYYPHIKESPAEKRERIQMVCSLLGHVFSHTSAKFMTYKEEGEYDA